VVQNPNPKIDHDEHNASRRNKSSGRGFEQDLHDLQDKEGRYARGLFFNPVNPVQEFFNHEHHEGHEMGQEGLLRRPFFVIRVCFVVEEEARPPGTETGR